MEIIIGGGRTATLEHPTGEIGEVAATVAEAHGVAGTLFTFKVDGVEANRYAPVTGIGDGACVELVEVPADGGEPAAVEELVEDEPTDE
mgnify:FL=1